jgi:hypothetical protein
MDCVPGSWREEMLSVTCAHKEPQEVVEHASDVWRRAVHQVLANTYNRFMAELTAIDTASTRVHPAGRPFCWTIQQVVEHLLLSLRASRKELEERLRKGRVSSSTHRTRAEWLLQMMVLGAGYMPVGVPAPEEISPAATLPMASGRELALELERELEMMDATLDICRKRFGMERVGRHFLLGPLRIDQWRRYHAVHLGHHLGQVRRIRQSIVVEVVHQRAVVNA